MLRTALILGLAAGVLAACDDDDNGNGNGNGQRDPQDRFGQVFASAFDADANDDPVDPMPGDLPAVSFTDDPIDF